ncbi:hypothetical protein ACLOJK_023906 [Asimina triloba]
MLVMGMTAEAELSSRSERERESGAGIDVAERRGAGKRQRRERSGERDAGGGAARDEMIERAVIGFYGRKGGRDLQVRYDAGKREIWERDR